MNMTFADRDFYYGDPAYNVGQPMQGLLSKDYAKARLGQMRKDGNDALVMPGDPYPFEGRKNPYTQFLEGRKQLTDSANKRNFLPAHDSGGTAMNTEREAYMERLWMGTTSVEAADKDGWVVSITPSGGWVPATIAGNTGVGMSQRLQSFVLDSAINPFNVVAPGKRPRVTLTPSMALKNGEPYVSFAVQGGDTQDQNLLQFFVNMVDFGMTVQQATEAANINSNQLWLSLGGTRLSDRRPRAGELLLSNKTPQATRDALKKMGYTISLGERTSGPINAIFLDKKHGTLWGGSSNNGEDYGIGW
jgi:gamma-glutamyltranspeptidase/glutathione hydrolase